MPETHWIYRPDATICGHSTREASRYNLRKIGWKWKKSRTLLACEHDIRVSWASTQFFLWDRICPRSLPHALGSSMPMSTDIVYPYTLPKYHRVISYHLSRYSELKYRKSVVWASGSSLSNDCHPCGGKRMSQIPAMFPKFPFAVDYCGFSRCLSLKTRIRKGCWWSSEASASALKISWPRGRTPGN